MLANDGKVIISTELDNNGFEKGIKSVKGSLGGLINVAKSLGAAIGVAFSVGAITNFAAESVKAANELSGALTGLQSILDGQGRSFSAAKKFLEEYTADGLVPMTNAVAAYKNLAARGYDDSQIQQTMAALKDASAFGRQSSYSMGEAVQSATEGLKNENSVLVDNAGVTKNVAKMWEEYAASIGVAVTDLTQEQKIQAEVNGILEETKHQAGDAAKVAGTLSGQLSQLSVNFNNLKVAVGNAVKPIVQTFLPAINTAVTAMTQLANSAATAMSLLFGNVSSGTADAVTEVADGYQNAASGAEDLKDATEEAGKAAKKYLAGFDEITKVGSSSSGGAAAGTGNAASTTVAATTEVQDEISPKMQALIDKIMAMLAPLKNIDFSPAVEAFGRLKEAVEPITSKLFEGLEWAWYNILVPLSEWTIENIIPGYLDLLSAALTLLDTAIEGMQPLGEWLWNEFLQPIATWTGGAVVDAINAFVDALNRISDWVNEHGEGISNFVIIISSIAGAFGSMAVLAGIAAAIKDIGLLASGASIAMSPFLGTIMAWVAQIWLAISNVGSWITGTLVPAVTTALTGIANALGLSVGWVVAIAVAVGVAVAAIIIYWDEIVAAVRIAWEKIKEVWGVVSGWFDENVMQPISAFFSNLWEGIKILAADAWEGIKEFFAPAVKWFSDLFGSVQQTISDVFYNIGVIASGCWQVIKVVWAGISSWFNKTVVQPVAGFFTNMWNGLKNGAINAWNGIKAAFGPVATWFKTSFSNAWQGVVSVFSTAGTIFTNIKNGILTAFKKIVNGLIDGLNNVIATPFNGINTALKAIKDIKILGLTPFSGLKTISVPKIPHLAEGAVLPANKPFLAMVGDQKHGTNIEAPLETIQEAVAIVMADMTGCMTAGFEATVALLREILEAVYGIEIGDDVIGQAVARYNSKMAIIKGGNA